MGLRALSVLHTTKPCRTTFRHYNSSGGLHSHIYLLVILAVRELRPADDKSQASLAWVVKPCSKSNDDNNNILWLFRMPYAYGPGALLSVYYRLSLVLLLTLRLSLSSLPKLLPFKPSSLLSKTYIWSNAHPELTCLIFFHLNSELTLPLAELFFFFLNVPASLQFHRQVSVSSFHPICCLHPSPHHSWPRPAHQRTASQHHSEDQN